MFSCRHLWADEKIDKERQISTAAVTLSQVIQDAEKRYSAVAVEAEMEVWKNSVVYEVDLIDLKGARKIEIKLNIASGKVLDEQVTSIASWFVENNKKLVAVEKSIANRFGIYEAIVFAKQHVDGRVYEADLKQEKGITFIKLSFLTPNGKKKFVVDIETKIIIPVLKR